MEVFDSVFGFLSFPVACQLRLCSRSFAYNSKLCLIVARHHMLFPALMAGPGGVRVVSSGGKEVLDAVLSLLKQFQDATSLSAFYAPEKDLGDGPMSVVDLRRHRTSGCYVAVKA
jgi:hypothetical protein